MFFNFGLQDNKSLAFICTHLTTNLSQIYIRINDAFLRNIYGNSQL